MSYSCRSRRASRFAMLAALGVFLQPIAAEAAPAASAAKQSAPPAAAPTIGEARAAAAAAQVPALASKLDELATSLPPFDALSLLEEFVPKLALSSERLDLSIRAGDLALLLGRYPEAAEHYEEASLAAAGGRDCGLLLRAARARLASGDVERATDLVSLVLLASAGDSELSARARLVGAWALAVQGRADEARDMSEAIAGSASAGSPAQAELRREARFLCWAVAEAAPKSPSRSAAAKILADEFPGSVEALVASGAMAAPPMPHWYLGSLSLAGAQDGGGEPPSTASIPSEAGRSTVPAPTGIQAMRFQVGYYSKEENAKTMKDRLRALGFAASIETRPRVREKQGDDGRRWAVVIDGGKDPEGTQARLKDAGYESYPIF